MIAHHIDPAADPNSRSRSFDLPLTRADIADFLGLTIETVSRQLTKLRADGVISIANNRHVTVDNMARLEARSGS
jgi:CRP/FNR family transcriptional regulator